MEKVISPLVKRLIALKQGNFHNSRLFLDVGYISSSILNDVVFKTLTQHSNPYFDKNYLGCLYDSKLTRREYVHIISSNETKYVNFVEGLESLSDVPTDYVFENEPGKDSFESYLKCFNSLKSSLPDNVKSYMPVDEKFLKSYYDSF